MKVSVLFCAALCAVANALPTATDPMATSTSTDSASSPTSTTLSSHPVLALISQDNSQSRRGEASSGNPHRPEREFQQILSAGVQSRHPTDRQTKPDHRMGWRRSRTDPEASGIWIRDRRGTIWVWCRCSETYFLLFLFFVVKKTMTATTTGKSSVKTRSSSTTVRTTAKTTSTFPRKTTGTSQTRAASSSTRMSTASSSRSSSSSPVR